MSEAADAALRTSSPVPSTNTSDEKSTSFMRESVTVVAPHSMSTWPPATALNRDCTVTGTHCTFSGATPSWRSMTPMTLRQSSTV